MPQGLAVEVEVALAMGGVSDGEESGQDGAWERYQRPNGKARPQVGPGFGLI